MWPYVFLHGGMELPLYLAVNISTLKKVTSTSVINTVVELTLC